MSGQENCSNSPAPKCCEAPKKDTVVKPPKCDNLPDTLSFKCPEDNCPPPQKPFCDAKPKDDCVPVGKPAPPPQSQDQCGPVSGGSGKKSSGNGGGSGGNACAPNTSCTVKPLSMEKK